SAPRRGAGRSKPPPTWVCASIRPGSSVLPARSTASAPSGGSEPAWPTRAIRPASTSTETPSRASAPVPSKRRAVDSHRGREAAAAEARVHGEPAELRDPAALVRALEAERAGRFAVDLDHEASERVGLPLGALDLGGHRVAAEVVPAGQEGPHVRLGVQLDEEVDVVRAGPADPHRRLFAGRDLHYPSDGLQSKMRFMG